VKTAGDFRKLIEHIPDDMEIEFSPVSMAWLGTTAPMRATEISIFTHDGWKTSTVEDPTGVCTVYLHEQT